MNYFIRSVFSPFVIAVLLIFSACETDIEKVKIITAKDNLPSETVKDAEIIYSDSAIVRIKIIAPSIERYTGENPYIELPEGVKVLFLAEAMRVKSQLTADYAVNYENKPTMEARGNVVLTNDIGEKLNTEHLIWDEEEEIVYSNEFVKITTAEEIIMGTGFESNQDFTKFKVKNIKGTITINEESTPKSMH